MDNFADERDFRILENDKYTFFVLRRIISGKCGLLLTDHERLIICYTCGPFPVWIWTPDDAAATEMEKAYQTASEHSLLNGKYHFNLKYDLAEFFIKRAAMDGKALSISTNMFAYDCPNSIKPLNAADGAIYQCREEDIDELADLMDLFHREIGIDKKSRDAYRLDAEKFINTGNMFFWKDENGNNVASCKYAVQGSMASVNLVFTRPEFRRRHYAENLVYQVTKRAKDAGCVPMLYTDADYTASNACYEKIGYVLKGKLCTVVNKESDMPKVKFYDTVDDALLKFAVIISKSCGKWVFCKHKERDTYEVPGGHREAGETIMETAERELREETGAVKFDIKPICVYSVTGKTIANETGEESFGLLCFAEIMEFSGVLEHEIEKVALMNELPKNWTYPLIQPKLIEKYLQTES